MAGRNDAHILNHLQDSQSWWEKKQARKEPKKKKLYSLKRTPICRKPKEKSPSKPITPKSSLKDSCTPKPTRQPKQRKPIKKGNRNAARNQRIYKLAWEVLPHFCANCSRPLLRYSARYAAHYLPKGAYPFIAGDIENISLLCQPGCHDMWDKEEGKEEMKIYDANRIAWLTRKNQELLKGATTEQLEIIKKEEYERHTF